MPAALTREAIAGSRPHYVRRGRPWQPDILLVEHQGRSVIVKDYAPRRWIYRVGVGLYSVWREATIYQVLDGIPGVPGFVGRIDCYALATEYIPGKGAGEAQPGEVGEVFFERLQDTVEAVHARGVALCDLRNMNNVLISDRGDPYVIDFAAAVRRGARWNVVLNTVFRLFVQDDRLGVIKLKRRLAPYLVTSEESKRYRKGVFMQSQVIAVRNWGRRWLKRLVGAKT
jgi:predicted Ser/Thr protein kinase